MVSSCDGKEYEVADSGGPFATNSSSNWFAALTALILPLDDTVICDGGRDCALGGRGSSWDGWRCGGIAEMQVTRMRREKRMCTDIVDDLSEQNNEWVEMGTRWWELVGSWIAE